MKKDDVYSWRVSSDTKAALERAARQEGRSVAQLLEDVVQDWLEKRGAGADEERHQKQLHASAAPWIGKLRGRDTRRSERAREKLRERLRARGAG